MKKGFIKLHAGAGFPVYYRADEIAVITEARFLFWRADILGADVTMRSGDTYGVKESPQEILDAIDNTL